MRMKIAFFLTPGILAMSLLSSPVQASPDNRFADALISASRVSDMAEAEDVYRDLIGLWDVRTLDYMDDGSVIEGRGEWHFARVLEGRAIQDVWIAPPRTGDGMRQSHPRSRYGSTLRTMDPVTRHWRIVFVNPVSGAFDLLDVRVENARIIHEGRRPSGQRIRWIFDSITDSAFHWYGEAEQPDGSWRREAEFFGRRTSP